MIYLNILQTQLFRFVREYGINDVNNAVYFIKTSNLPERYIELPIVPEHLLSSNLRFIFNHYRYSIPMF